jgi:citrate synthase
MFTVMFAIGRLPGWIAQWKEMRENKSLLEDQGKYTGSPLRDFKTVDKR